MEVSPRCTKAINGSDRRDRAIRQAVQGLQHFLAGDRTLLTELLQPAHRCAHHLGNGLRHRRCVLSDGAQFIALQDAAAEGLLQLQHPPADLGIALPGAPGRLGVAQKGAFDVLERNASRPQGCIKVGDALLRFGVADT